MLPMHARLGEGAFHEPSRNADTPVRAVLPPHNNADRSVRVTKSAIRFMAATREHPLVETTHEPSSRRIAELINSAILAGRRFMAPDARPKLEVETFHEPGRHKDNCELHEVRNYPLPVHGLNACPELEVEITHDPVIRYHVAEENATDVAFSSAHRFKVAMRAHPDTAPTCRASATRSAGFQPAVSPTSSRQTVGITQRQRVGNPRYGRLEVCATGAVSRCALAMPVQKLEVETFHEPGRNRSLSICELLMHMHQKLVIGPRRFMVSMRSQELEGDPFHEPMVDYRVAEENATAVAFVSAQRFIPKTGVGQTRMSASRRTSDFGFMAPMRDQELEVEAFHKPCRSRRKEARFFHDAEVAQSQSLLTWAPTDRRRFAP